MRKTTNAETGEVIHVKHKGDKDRSMTEVVYLNMEADLDAIITSLIQSRAVQAGTKLPMETCARC